MKLRHVVRIGRAVPGPELGEAVEGARRQLIHDRPQIDRGVLDRRARQPDAEIRPDGAGRGGAQARGVLQRLDLVEDDGAEGISRRLCW